MVTIQVEAGERWASTVDAVRSCSDDDLIRIVEAAKPSALRVCLYQLTGEERIRDIQVSAPYHPDTGLIPVVVSPEDVTWLRERAVELLRSYRDGLAEAPLLSQGRFRRLMELLFGVQIATYEVDFWWEEFAAVPHPRGCDWFGSLSPEQANQFKVVVIGAGMGGITTAMNLDLAGIPYVVVEKNDGVGGTWHSNIYPGARVDIVSRAYSYTWEPDWPWEHYYAPQAELKAYFEHIVDKHDLRKNIMVNTEVTEAVWNEADQQWNLVIKNTKTGVVERLDANVIVSAIGLFQGYSMPDIEGIDDFKGRIIHTAKWDPTYDLSGKRIASIGTGSSGVQIVAPLAERAEQLYVFQRSGTWVQPTPDYVSRVPDDEQWLLDNLPFYLNWSRVMAVYPSSDHRLPDVRMQEIDPTWDDPDTNSAWNKQIRDGLMKHLMSKIGDRPDLLEKCIPSYPPLAKRLPKDNGWFEALLMDHVELISDPIERFTPKGIRTTTGDDYEVDLIVLATGFRANDFLMSIDFVGRDGMTLPELWRVDGPRAYLGITIPKFPNLFCLYGPNTNGKASGPCAWGELQSRYAMESIKFMLDNRLSSMDVKGEVYDEFNQLVDERSKYMPWMDQRQTSYYRNEFGRSATNGPFVNRDYWPWTRRPRPDDYVTVPAPTGTDAAGGQASQDRDMQEVASATASQ